MNLDDSIALLQHLLEQPRESEWLEFKENNGDPQDIGEYISALANSAALEKVEYAYLVWGVTDPPTQRFVGTTFSSSRAKIGNEELEGWLTRLLAPQVDFRFIEFECDGKSVVILRIPAAYYAPVSFKHTQYIRIGTYKKSFTRTWPSRRRFGPFFVRPALLRVRSQRLALLSTRW